MSSSHLFFGLPTGLLVLTLLFKPGCQSKILLVHRSFGRGAILFVILHFILVCVSIQQSICIFHVFFGFFSASSDELNPFLFFFTFVNFFITVFLERNIIVLIFV